MIDPYEWPYPVPEDSLVASVRINGNPIPKARPRLGACGNVYTPRTTSAFEDEVGWALKIPLKGRPVEARRLYVLRVVFYRSTKGKADVDNLCKGVCDGANGIVWADDSQCRTIFAHVYLGCKDPHTDIVIHYAEEEK